MDAGLGLWAIDMQGHWTTLGSTPGATALGRTTGGVAVGTGHQIDVRPASVSELRLEGGKGVLVRLNDLCHLGRL